MNLLQRLRTPDRRAATLAWVLLLAVACAPMARAMAPTQRTVLVPFCTAGGGAAPGHGAPRDIALRFTACLSVGAPGVGPALPPSSHAAPPRPAAAATRVGLQRSAPAPATPIGRRPPPRAPPSRPA